MAIRTLEPEAPTHSAAPPPLGHNRPPIEEAIPLEFREALLSERADFLIVMDNYLGVGNPNAEDYKPGAVHRATATDEASLALCGKVINTLRAMTAHVKKTHDDVKAPHLLAGRLVDLEQNTILARIEAGREIVAGLQAKYANDQLITLRKKQKQEADDAAEELRIYRAELAEQKRIDDEARANNMPVVHVAPPPPPPPPAPVEAPRGPIRTDGATVSLGTEWYAQVDDYVKAFKSVSTDSKVREAMDAALNRIVKASKAATKIPGVTAMECAKVSNR